MNKKQIFLVMLSLVLLAIIVAPVQAGNGPVEPVDPPNKPEGIDLTYPWFPGDPAWLECDRVDGVDGLLYPYSVRIGTGNAIDPDYGLTRDVYDNTISVFEVWTQGLDYPVAFDWEATDLIGIVIVKSGAAANVYYYEDGAYSAEDLVGVEPWEPSHLTFCWGSGEEPPEPPGPQTCDWVDETAWGAGFPYVEQGNWGFYTEYETGSNILILAGQNMDAGAMNFSVPDVDGNVTITIELFDGWRFAKVKENVKIQPYLNEDDIPNTNPIPGLFEIKDTAKTNPYYIDVPYAPFYGIHLDLEWEDCD